MIILIENFKYKLKAIEKFLPSKFYTLINEEFVIIDYCGYYYNFEIKKPIFILPKVFIKENKFLGKYEIGNLINFNLDLNTKKLLTEFIFIFYKSLIEFKQRTKKKFNFYNYPLLESSIIGNKNNISFFDIILSLFDFYKKNKNIFILELKESKKGKINWNKTIKKTQPIIVDDTPIYTIHYKKNFSKTLNSELIIIYLFTLSEISKLYNFKILFSSSLEQILNQNKNFFQSFKKNPVKNLKKIKNNYFSDIFKKLYNLLYSYYSHIEFNNINKKHKEFIIIKNYNIVFEDMIDKLFSDELPEDLEVLKYQQDGKIIDHIFKYHSIIKNKNEQIYYIGDSKYYKETTKYSTYNLYKQVTYAKNVIQYNINLLNNNNKNIDDNVFYRDSLTEGYNITPNFFIEGHINFETFSYKEIYLIKKSEKPFCIYHFENRLFDRDTLFVFFYSINFLFVIYSYITYNKHSLDKFKKYYKKMFRDEIIKFLNKKYAFYKKTFSNKKELEVFVNKYFKLLIGKMISINNTLFVALEKNTNNIKILNILKDTNFDIFVLEGPINKTV
ncbi:hypothetical protein [Nautilia sp.]